MSFINSMLLSLLFLFWPLTRNSSFAAQNGIVCRVVVSVYLFVCFGGRGGAEEGRGRTAVWTS